MANGSSSKFGILQDRNASGQLQQVRLMILIGFLFIINNFSNIASTHWNTLFGCWHLDYGTYYTFLKYLFFAAYYRGAMGILLVYDVTDEASFNSTVPFCCISLKSADLCKTRKISMFFTFHGSIHLASNDFRYQELDSQHWATCFG